MKVTVKHVKSFFDEPQLGVIDKFIMFLQKELPLDEEVTIDFTKDRPKNMTTGMRLSTHTMYVLGRDRMLADILRTLAHEWAHEFEHQQFKLKEKPYKKIGGFVENFANIMAGALLKKFESHHSKEKKIIYDEK